MSTMRKPRLTFTTEQRRDYAKLIVNENYSVKQVMEISGAGQTAVNRWKSLYPYRRHQYKFVGLGYGHENLYLKP